ncbi:MAG TPA: sulfite exporter TauE/SafE family protein [Tepidisphaeraceae bacterium]|nr:sulfite exporter TauE/SafE family protein [Tepidisphaeraceae bacterium]
MDSITLYVVAVVFVATLFRSTFGFGEALVAVPLLSMWVPLKISAPLAVMMSVLVSTVILLQDWEKVKVRSAGALILATLPGIPIGLWLLKAGGDRVGRVMVAGILIVFSSYSLIRRQRHAAANPSAQHPAWVAVAGFIAGILGGAYAMNGPPLAILGSMRKWSPQHFRATLQGYFFPASVVGLIGYSLAGFWTPVVTRYSLVSLPAALVAIFLGRWINHRLHPLSFMTYVHSVLLAMGISQLVQVVWR